MKGLCAYGPWAAAALAVMAAGCIEDFEPAWLVQDNRVLGARAEVRSEPERASVAPGETVDVRWLVVDPGEPRPITWAFAWCPAAPVSVGQPFCVEGSELRVPPPQLEPVADDPSLSFTVPEARLLDGAQAILVAGVICAGGTPSLDPSRLDDPDALAEPCEGTDPRGTLVTLEVPLEPDSGANRHPTLAELTLDGTSWPAPPASVLDAPQAGCPSDPALPEVAAGGPEREIGMRVPAASREVFEREGPDGEPVSTVEELQVEHVTTARQLDRLFSFLDAPDQLEETVTWEPAVPDDLVADRQLVRMHFVVVDDRGGAAFETRALCLTR